MEIENQEKFYEQYHLEDDFEDVFWDLGCRHGRKVIFDFIEVKEGKVLDVGAGLGILLSELNSSLEKYALECSSSTVKLGKDRFKDLKWSIADAQNMPYKDNFFDLVVSCHSLEHITNDKKVIDEIFRILKNEGQLILYLPSNSRGILKEVYRKKNRHLRAYTKEMVINLLGDRFKIEKCVYPARFLSSFWWIFRNILIFKNTIIKMMRKKANFIYYFRRFVLRKNINDNLLKNYDKYQYCHTSWYRKFVLPILEFIIFPIDSFFGKLRFNLVGFMNGYDQSICISARKISAGN